MNKNRSNEAVAAPFLQCGPGPLTRWDSERGSGPTAGQWLRVSQEPISPGPLLGFPLVLGHKHNISATRQGPNTVPSVTCPGPRARLGVRNVIVELIW